MAFETQPSALPTNKVLTATAVLVLVMPVLDTYLGPAAADAWTALVGGTGFDTPAISSLIGGLVKAALGLAAAYWVPDRAGIPQ